MATPNKKGKQNYAWPCGVNVANFVTVKPCVKGDERSNFNNWKEQMLCLLEGQDVVGFVDGEIVPPEEDETEQHKLWRRTDRLIKGWILGSVGTDVLDAVRGKETAMEVWSELENIFKEEEEGREEQEVEEEQEEGSVEDLSRYLPLYKAALTGHRDTEKNFFQELSSSVVSSQSETALHVAVLTGKANLDFVNKLVGMMPPEALALENSSGQTALHYAAFVGNTEAAKALVKKNPDLLDMSSKNKRLPVLEAAISCQKKTLEYLISEHKANAEHKPLLFEGELGVELLNAIIASEYVDIALDLAYKYPKLARLKDTDGDYALSTIAETDTLFPRTKTFSWWKRFIFHRSPLIKSKSEADPHTKSVSGDIENLSSNGAAHNNNSTLFQIISGVGEKLESMIWNGMENLVPTVKEVREKKARRKQALQLAEFLCDQIVNELPEKEASPIFERSIKRAAKNGISEIVEMIIRKYPMVSLYTNDDAGRNIFQLAASNRFEDVINLIYNMSDRKYMFFDHTDDERNNLLHICGKLAPSYRLNLVAGAALQMQRELQWFKEMEKFVYPSRRTWPNKEEKTPQMIFTNEHEKLKADGERWMKDTANACTIAAALIATVMFAAAFTVPGGLDSATGIPLLSGDPIFNVFAVTDAISLFTSITSLLMFLSILTSRYAEEDFLCILPRRLSIGLLSLFVSITFMLVAFSATLYLLLQRGGQMTWFVVLVATFACLPVASFVLLQFPLLVDVVCSTYGPGIFGKKKSDDRLLY